MSTLLAISFFTTHFDLLKQHWEKQAILRKKGVLGTNVPAPADQQGLIALIDWEKQKLIKTVEQRSPSGLLVDKNNLYVNDAKENVINKYDVERLQLLGIIKNKQFNDLHSIRLSNKNNLLITSSGLDLIQIVDSNGISEYQWWGFEHGFDENPLGEKLEYFKDKDYSNTRIPTLKQATHINYAYERENGKILASLFHQGKIIQIDRNNNTCKTIIDNLKQPHTVLEFEEKFFIADSNNGRVLILDKKFTLISEIKIGSSWIQDIAIQKGLNGISRLFVVDATNTILYEYNLQDLSLVSSFKMNSNWRISGISIIEG